MADTAWLSEARKYGAMSEQSRATYWQQLSTEQQAALLDAINALSASPRPALISSGRQPKSGFGKTLAVGCMGMVLGCVITVGAEVILVLQGFHMLGDAITQPLRPSQTSPQAEPRVVDCNDPIQLQQHESQCAWESKLRRENDEKYGTDLEPK